MKEGQTKKLLYLSLSFLIGLWFGLFFHYFCLFLAWFIFLIIFYFSQKEKKFFIFILFLFFSLSFMRAGSSQCQPFLLTSIDNFFGQGWVCQEPERRGNRQKIVVCSNFPGKILVYKNVYPVLSFGDRIDFFGSLEKPENFSDFDYVNYLALSKIYAVSYYPEVKKTGEYKPKKIIDRFFLIFQKNIFAGKAKARKIIQAGLPEPKASLAQAMVLGDKYSLNQNLRDALSKSGLAHVAAISGLHIGLLIFLLLKLLQPIFWLRGRKKILIAILLFLYIVLIGSPASAVRAGIMGGLVLFFGGKKIWLWLFLSAFVWLWHSPASLIYDIGFQLSFLAVLAIFTIFPFLKEKIGTKIKLSNRPKLILTLLDIFLISLSVQALTLPIVFWNFGSIAWLSPLSNMAFIWLLPFLLTSLFVAIFLGLLFPFWVTFLFLPANFIFEYFLVIVDFFA